MLTSFNRLIGSLVPESGPVVRLERHIGVTEITCGESTWTSHFPIPNWGWVVHERLTIARIFRGKVKFGSTKLILNDIGARICLEDGDGRALITFVPMWKDSASAELFGTLYLADEHPFGAHMAPMLALVAQRAAYLTPPLRIG
jgi:hypothetical protein